MIIPTNKYTQDQLAAWINKAKTPCMDSYKESIQWKAWKKWFLHKIDSMVIDPNCWVLTALSVFKDGARDEESLTEEFLFALVDSDRYIWDSQGYRLTCPRDIERETNLIFNGSMINHGTQDNPEWSSHT